MRTCGRLLHLALVEHHFKLQFNVVTEMEFPFFAASKCAVEVRLLGGRATTLNYSCHNPFLSVGYDRINILEIALTR